MKQWNGKLALKDTNVDGFKDEEDVGAVHVKSITEAIIEEHKQSKGPSVLGYRP